MFEELKEQYRKSLQDKLRLLKELLPELRKGDSDAVERIRQMAHSLNGSGATFGYSEISTAAKAVEDAGPDQMVARLPQLVKVLLEATAGGPSTEALAERLVLLVEDDEDISGLLRALIQQQSVDYKVVVAPTGARARELMAQRKFSMVVLDLLLPDMDGRVLLREAHERLGQRASIYVLSGVDRESVRNECLALGARDYFTKPFNPTQIAQQLAEALRGRQPVVVPTSPPPVPVPTTSPPDVKAPVLLAEDDLLLAGLIKHRLSREGIQVKHVQTGAAAYEALKAERPSLVILDVKMPVMDGFEVLTRLRDELGYRDLPVVILTAMGSEKDVVRGYELGADDYIVKPFSPPELLARVRSLLRS